MAYLSITDARNDILMLFQTAWVAGGVDSDGNPVPVAYDDVPFDRPAAGSPWARLEMRHTSGAQATVGGAPGSRRFRRFGIITVKLFTPMGQGLTLSDTLVNVTLGAFEGMQTKVDGAFFYNCHTVEVGQSDDWHQTNVLIEFQWDQIR